MLTTFPTANLELILIIMSGLNRITYYINISLTRRSHMGNESEFKAYLEFECEANEDRPSIFIEFPISLKVFCIALALSKAEENEDIPL